MYDTPFFKKSIISSPLIQKTGPTGIYDHRVHNPFDLAHRSSRKPQPPTFHPFYARNYLTISDLSPPLLIRPCLLYTFYSYLKSATDSLQP
jgi:hypothetical protein